MDNKWVTPQAWTLNLDNYETLNNPSSFPLLPACLELLTSLCQFLPFFFGAVEMQINLGVEVAGLEA